MFCFIIFTAVLAIAYIAYAVNFSRLKQNCLFCYKREKKNA